MINSWAECWKERGVVSVKKVGTSSVEVWKKLIFVRTFFVV